MDNLLKTCCFCLDDINTNDMEISCCKQAYHSICLKKIKTSFKKCLICKKPLINTMPLKNTIPSINTMPFLTPLEYQPNGSTNFSRAYDREHSNGFFINFNE